MSTTDATNENWAIKSRENKTAKDTTPLFIITEKKWTDKDLQEFAEWCSKKLWEYSDKIERWRHPLYSSKTTSQLREMWEVETGRREK